MIAIVDYRAGNLASVKKAVEFAGAEAGVTADADAIRQAEKIILPGVGHFSSTKALDGVRAAITEVIANGTPFLGICVGMQWMYAGSSEAPGVPGLGIVEGTCERFAEGMKCPHVGWNRIRKIRGSRLLTHVEDGAFVYYTHSYRGPVGPECVAVTDYGEEFAAVVENGNVFGVQFHPEKSGEAGLQILRNFIGMTKIPRPC